jgi:hypothetical protein
VGLALDRIQLGDLRKDPEGALRPTTAPSGASRAQQAVAGPAAALMAQAARLRRAMNATDPGKAFDLSFAGRTTHVLEDLYITNYASRNIRRVIDRALKQERATVALQLRLEHDINLAREMSEAKSRELLDKKWADFLADQKRRSDGAAEARTEELRGERVRLRLQGPRL